MTTAVPPVVRAEGLTELIGDLVAVCQNSTSNTPIDSFAEVDISLSLNVFVTNNVDFGAGADVTDAVLVVNENQCRSPAAQGGVFGSCGAYSPYFQDPQYGKLAAANRLEWHGVRFPIPYGIPPGSPQNPSVTTLRLSGVRAYAAQLGVPDAATFPSTQITGFFSIIVPNPSPTGVSVIPATNNVLNVAVPILGLIVEPDDTVVGLQCMDESIENTITLTEGFATAWKSLGAPTFVPGNNQWESGYFAPGSNNGGGASQATRFLLRLRNVPSGVSIQAPKNIQLGSPSITMDAVELRMVFGADANGAGGAATMETDLADVPLSLGAATIVYEVFDSDPFRVEHVDIPLSLSWTSGSADVGLMTIDAMFGPVSDVAVADGPAPEPRFTDLNRASDALDIQPCTTTLLFPYAANQFGGDTRITIANPSGLLPGAQPQTGACTLHYHGQTSGGGAAPPDQTSAPLAPGEQLDFTLSAGSPADLIAGAPDFGGYLMAVCEFLDAEGTAVVSDGLGRRTEHRAEQAASPVSIRTPDTKTLLFPYLSNQNGRAAEIVVSNTTRDWLGTTEEAGACSVDFFGQNAPAPLSTAVWPAGSQFKLDLSTLAPGFEGSVAVSCGFSLARGIARQFGATPEPHSFSVDPILIDPPGTNPAPTPLLYKRVVSNASFDTTWTLFNHGVSSALCAVDVRNRPNLPPVPTQNISLAPGEFVLNRLADLGTPVQGFMTAVCDQPDVYGTAQTLSTPSSIFQADVSYNAEPLALPRDQGPAPFILPFIEQNGLVDRQISIINTTSDGLGTPGQNGSCTVKHYGESSFGAGPLPDRTLSIPAGQYRSYALDGLVAGAGLTDFTGFAVVDCDFPHARGYDTRADRRP